MPKGGPLVSGQCKCGVALDDTSAAFSDTSVALDDTSAAPERLFECVPRACPRLLHGRGLRSKCRRSGDSQVFLKAVLLTGSS